MSGGAGGIVGAVVLLMFLPQILMIAAGTAAAAGVLATAGAIIGQLKNAETDAEARQQETEMLCQCSKQLQDFCGKIHEHSENADLRKREFYQRVSENLSNIQAETMQLSENMGLEEVSRYIVEKGRKDLFQMMDQEFSAMIDREDALYEEERRQQKELEGFQKIACGYSQLQEKIERREEAQKEKARQMMTDAEGSFHILKARSARYGAAGTEQLQAIETLYAGMCDSFQAGMYEDTMIRADKVLRQSLILAGELEHDSLRKELLKTKLAAQYEYLETWMEEMRYVDVEPGEACNREIHADLNIFCQGELQSFKELLSAKRKELEESQYWTEAQFQELSLECTGVLAARGERIIKVAYGVLMNYLKKAEVMEALISFMEEQGYEADWSASKGEDGSQQMITHFLNPMSDSEISIVVDSDTPEEEYSNIGLKVHSFEKDESDIDEMRREKLRLSMMEALQARGILMETPLHCDIGTENKSSALTEYRDFEKVAAMKAEPLKF